MRTALIGICLILLGLTALYQMRNGALLYAYQQFYYDPPTEAAALPVAFGMLAEEKSGTTGVTLGDVALARLACAEDLLGAQPPFEAAVAFQRLNLVLLGAGMGLKSPLIDPVAHYVGELRRDLGRDWAVFSTTPLDDKKLARLVEHLGEMTAIDHPLFFDLRLTVEQHRRGLLVLTDALISGGQHFYDCVNESKI